MRPNVYGYWIGKDEIFEVGYECHAEKGAGILIERFGERAHKLLQEFGTYAVMYRLGYVRVVNYSHDGHGVEHRTHFKLSRLQKSFVNDANHIDIVDHRGRTIESIQNR